MSVMTLADLAELVGQWRDREDVVISAEEWRHLVDYISSWQVVAATPDRPAFFWFRDKRIVTPAYVMAVRLASAFCTTCEGDHDTIKHLRRVQEAEADARR